MNRESEAKDDLLINIIKLDRGVAYYQFIATTIARAMYEVKRSDGQSSYVLDPDNLREMDVDEKVRDFIRLIQMEDLPHEKVNSVPEKEI